VVVKPGALTTSVWVPASIAPRHGVVPTGWPSIMTVACGAFESTISVPWPARSVIATSWRSPYSTATIIVRRAGPASSTSWWLPPSSVSFSGVAPRGWPSMITLAPTGSLVIWTSPGRARSSASLPVTLARSGAPGLPSR
jgi:hypothetical protein